MPTDPMPRPEYPRPSFARPDWLCLNGQWQFEMDPGDSGLERGLRDRALEGTITVPFCPESTLSGIGNEDFMRAVWYRREVEIPADWNGRRVLLHFQAVDEDSTVWVNGKEAARHRGGMTPIGIDLSGFAEPGESFTLCVRARDLHAGPGPRGKQSDSYDRRGCHYTRTTGIWQTVWMEPVGKVASFKRPRITPDLANGVFHLALPLDGRVGGLSVKATLTDGAGEVVSAEAAVQDFSPLLTLKIPGDRRRPWSIDDPHLYGLKLELMHDGKVIDAAESYAGLRSVTIDGKAIKLNGQTVFQRLVLDQGYYPDGILTAPTDQALIDDIKLSIEAGFNGARLHQKVFEERFLHHADVLGYLCWGEFPDWGCNVGGRDGENQQPSPTYITQWLECLERDYSHPSIVGWCGMNETWQPLTDRLTLLDDVMRGMFLAAKAMDVTRPVLDTSGYSHRVHETDVYDSHDYEQDPEKFKATHAGLVDEKPYRNMHNVKQEQSLPYAGQPYFVSEFGGIWWNPDTGLGEASWGYGERPKSVEEFYARFDGLCAALLNDPKMFGYCYTQLTDVFQEENGIYHFDRKPKFDMGRIRASQTKRAAIEKEM